MLRSKSGVLPVLGALLLFSSIGLLPGLASAVVVPGSLESVEGNNANCFPLTGCTDRDRYQQVFESSEFSGVLVIGEIRFRRDGGSPTPFSTTFSNVSIGLSTTSAASDALSTNFAANRGSDFRSVRNGSLTLSSASSGGSPAPLDVSVVFDRPFVYDPSQGNLLLDWTNFGGESFPNVFYDAENTPGDPVSRLYAGSVGATSGTADTIGLVVEFVEFAGDQACCEEGQAPIRGCIDPAIQLAVCSADRFCCETRWDEVCVREVTTVAGENCHCCFAAPRAEGCYEPSAPAGPSSVAECVCAADSFCCTGRWDSICASEVESLGCGVCEPSVAMVVDDATETVTVFDTDRDVAIGGVPLSPADGDYGDCSITKDLGAGFVTTFRGEVSAIDPLSVAPATAPNPIPIDNPGEDTSLTFDQRFLVVCDGAVVAPVSVIDVATHTVVDTFSTGSDCNSVEVCNNGSVLVTSTVAQELRRLTIDATGTLADTGEVLPVLLPTNVLCAPDATSGVVVTGFGQMMSFTIPGLTAVDMRDLSGDFAVSGVVDPTRGRVYLRSESGRSGSLEAFAFDFLTGALGSTPLFSVPIDGGSGLFGVDQLALHPDGSRLYVSQPGSVAVRSPDNGLLIREVEFPDIVDPTGVCVVPEPAAGLQLAAGVVLLAALWRLRRRRGRWRARCAQRSRTSQITRIVALAGTVASQPMRSAS